MDRFSRHVELQLYAYFSFDCEAVVGDIETNLNLKIKLKLYF